MPSVRSCRVPVREGLVARGEHACPVGRVRPAVAGRPRLALDPADVLPPPVPAAAPAAQARTSTCSAGSAAVGGWTWAGTARGGPAGRRSAAGRRAGSRRTCWSSGVGAPGCWRRWARPRRAPGSCCSRPEATIGGGWRTERGRYHGRRSSLGQLAEDARASGIEVLTGVQAIGWYDGLVTAIEADAHLEIAAPGVIAATGSYERVPLVPGADRPGVMAARMVIGLCERYGILPGDRVLLIGSGQELGTAGELVAGAGAAELIGPVDTDALVAIRGRDRVIGADVAARRPAAAHRGGRGRVRRPEPEPRPRPRGGRGRRVAGDTLVPVADAAGRTTVASLVGGRIRGRAIDHGRGGRRCGPIGGPGRGPSGRRDARPRRSRRAASADPRWPGARGRPPSRGARSAASARTSAPGRSGRSRPRATPTPSWSSAGPAR